MLQALRFFILSKKTTSSNKRCCGYSIVESLAVVSILSVLATMLVPVYFESRASVLHARVLKELDSIASAAKSYYADVYTLKDISLQTLNSGGYLSTVNKDPWGNNYVIVADYRDANSDGKPDIGTIVFVYSVGKDGISQTNHSTGEKTGEESDDISTIILRVE